jgi:hypothetical protein
VSAKKISIASITAASAVVTPAPTVHTLPAASPRAASTVEVTPSALTVPVTGAQV